MKKQQNKLQYYNPQQLITEFSKDKNVKQVTRQVPFSKEVDLTDIQISAGGNDEDLQYVYNKNYQMNIRRGNTVATIFDNRGNPVNDFKVRKGLPKFFDLYREYIEYNLGHTQELSSFGVKNQSEHTSIQQIIFKDVKQALQNGRKIEILKMNKANGENCQISYFPEKKSWIIASKNVSLMAQYRSDIDLFNQNRYHYAKLIAHAWFDILQDIGNKQVKELKQDLSNMTLVGEYCGNRDYQHLVKYEEIDLHFFGLVDNESTSILCIPPNEFFEFLRQYNLTEVRHQSLGVFDNWKDLNENLLKAFDKTASASIEEEEEGSVIYLIKKANENNEDDFDEVLSISKLKTLEYRLYRKLREKLRTFIEKKYINKETLILRYQEECKDLCKQNLPSRPLEYYFKVAQTAFQFAQQYNQFSDLVHKQYITFLSIVIYCVEKNTNVTPNLFFKQGLSDAILSKPWSKYSTEKALENYKEVEKKQFHAKQGSKKLTVFIPVSIPGMGKTTFRNILNEVLHKKTGQNLIIVSSDEIRRNLMDERKQKFPNETQDQLFENTSQQVFSVWNKEIKKAIQQKTQELQSEEVYVFVDKNHPPNGIEKSVKQIKDFCPSNYELDIVGLIPETSNEDKFQSSEEYKFPFSLQLMLECLNRVQFRKEHPTLPGSGSKSANIMILFLNMFRNVTLSDQLCKQAGMTRVLRFPFHKPSQINIDKNLIQEFSHILNVTVPGSQCEDLKLVKQFATNFEKQNIQFPQTSLQEIQTLVEQTFDNKFENSQLITNNNNKDDNHTETQNIDKQEEIKSEDNSKLENQQIQPNNQNGQQNQQQKQQNQENQQTEKIIYQGVFAQDLENAQNNIQSHVIKSLEYLKNNIQNYNKKSIDKDIESIQNLTEFQFPASIHLTTLFIGGRKYEKLNSQEQEIFQTFKEDQNININIQAIAYVPNRLVCGISQLSDQSIQIFNKYPHVTMFLNKFTAKMSNDVLQSVLNSKILKQIEEKQELVEQFSNINLNKEVHEIFIIKISDGNKLIIPGITKNFINSKAQKQQKKEQKNTTQINQKSILKKNSKKSQQKYKQIQIQTPEVIQENQEQIQENLSNVDQVKENNQQIKSNTVKDSSIKETENPEDLDKSPSKIKEEQKKTFNNKSKKNAKYVLKPIDYQEMSQEEIDQLRYQQRGLTKKPKILYIKKQQQQE